MSSHRVTSQRPPLEIGGLAWVKDHIAGFREHERYGTLVMFAPLSEDVEDPYAGRQYLATHVMAEHPELPKIAEWLQNDPWGVVALFGISDAIEQQRPPYPPYIDSLRSLCAALDEKTND